jgi:hypothetical protein
LYSWVVRSVTPPASDVTESWIPGAYCERILCPVVCITGASQSRESPHLHLGTAEQPPTTQPIHAKVPLLHTSPFLNFRHRASSYIGQAFRYYPENAFYIFNQQIYFIVWYLLDRASLI